MGEAEADVVTPPERFHQLPPSPPDTDEKAAVASPTPASLVLSLCEDHKHGVGPEATWATVPLGGAQFLEFERLLEARPSLSGYVEDKIR